MKNSSTPPTRRLIIPDTTKKSKELLADISAESVLDAALTIAATEVTRYQTKVAKGQSLDLKEARVIHGWIDSMLSVLREQREQTRAAKLENMSDEEMYALARKVLSDGSSIVTTESKPVVEENEED